MTTTITLSNGCVVRVGDVVPMAGGRAWCQVLSIDTNSILLSNEMLYEFDGRCLSHAYTGGKIDLAALALSRAPAVASVAVLRGLVERWQNRRGAIQRAIDARAYTEGGAKTMVSCSTSIATCIDELARLIGEEKKDAG